MGVSFVDKTGTTGAIWGDFTIVAEAPVSKEVRLYVKGKKRVTKDPAHTVTDPSPRFLIEFFVETSVRKVEPVSISDFSSENQLVHAF